MNIFKRNVKHTTGEVADTLADFAGSIRCNTAGAKEAAVEAITKMTHATKIEAREAVRQAWKKRFPCTLEAQNEYLKMCSNGIREYCTQKKEDAPCIFGFEGGCDLCALWELPQFWPKFKEGEDHV